MGLLYPEVMEMIEVVHTENNVRWTKHGGAMTLRPKRHWVLLSQVPGIAVVVSVLWLLESLLTLNLNLVSALIGWAVASLLFSGQWVDRGAVHVWDRTIAGPGGLFAGRVMGMLGRSSCEGVVRSNLWNRINGVSVISTAEGRIRIYKHWYNPHERREFLRDLERIGANAS